MNSARFICQVMPSFAPDNTDVMFRLITDTEKDAMCTSQYIAKLLEDREYVTLKQLVLNIDHTLSRDSLIVSRKRVYWKSSDILERVPKITNFGCYYEVNLPWDKAMEMEESE